ncbi:MAG: hypothetical protein PHE88_09880 [Elusimicrobia bacterium]|nr:hypothetical protein [Elusimicrobiota bacterium]
MWNVSCKPRWVRGVVLLLLILSVDKAYAHRDDYLDETLVYLTLERAEVETEYWFDYGNNRQNANNFLRHHAAVEWGITDHWMVDGRGTIKSAIGDATTFDGGRIESRYRFAEENALPVDIAISGELNWERNKTGDITSGIEPRVVLSKDFREKLNFTLNMSEELRFNVGTPAFLIAAGIRYNWTELVRIGTELHYDTQDHAGSLIPQVWFALQKGVTAKVGYSAGLDNNYEDFGRLAFEVEF